MHCIHFTSCRRLTENIECIPKNCSMAVPRGKACTCPFNVYIFPTKQTKVVSSNADHGEVYSIQLYVIKFATGLWFSLGTRISSINKTDRHNIAEILLKVALNTISLTLTSTIVFL